MDSLGQCGERTRGLIIGSFFVFSVFSLAPVSSLPFSLSRLKFNVEPAKRLDFDEPSGSFGLNKLPQLMRRDAAGEQFKKRICSESKPSVFGFTPECRRSFSASYSLTVKLGEWLEWRRISLIRCTRNELPISGDGGSTNTCTFDWDFCTLNKNTMQKYQLNFHNRFYKKNICSNPIYLNCIPKALKNNSLCKFGRTKYTFTTKFSIFRKMELPWNGMITYNVKYRV